MCLVAASSWHNLTQWQEGREWWTFNQQVNQMHSLLPSERFNTDPRLCERNEMRSKWPTKCSSVEEEKRGETKAKACWTVTGDVSWLSKCSPHNWTATTERGWFRVYIPCDEQVCNIFFPTCWPAIAQILCWRPPRVVASLRTGCAADLLRSDGNAERTPDNNGIIAACPAAKPCSWPSGKDECMVFVEDKLVFFQKSLAVQVSDRRT